MARTAKSASALAVLTVSVVSLVGCSSSNSSSSNSPSSTASAAAPTASATSSATEPYPSGDDKPLGEQTFNMTSSGSEKAEDPGQSSGVGATDCYVAGSRIYDRDGISCSDAQSVLTAYQKLPEGKSGKQASVQGYACSHNPPEMVGQGAAPGKCLNDDGDVVFDWRYPGAPVPR